MEIRLYSTILLHFTTQGTEKPILYQFGMPVPKIAPRQRIYTHIKYTNAKIWDKLFVEYKAVSLS